MQKTFLVLPLVLIAALLQLPGGVQAQAADAGDNLPSAFGRYRPNLILVGKNTGWMRPVY